MGQSTVELAVVASALACVMVGLGLMWRALSGGLFVDHALMAASHHLALVSPGNAADILLH